MVPEPGAPEAVEGVIDRVGGLEVQGEITVYCTGALAVCAVLAASFNIMVMVVVPGAAVDEDMTLSTMLPAAPGARVMLPEEGVALEVQPVGS